MNIHSLLLPLGTALASVCLLPVTAMAAPKKVLVVSVTTGFRHSSIPTMNRVIGELGAASKAFTVDYLEQPPGKPTTPNRPKALAADASAADQAKFNEAQAKFDAAQPAFKEAEAKWQPLLKVALLKLSAESLKNYDAVIFANTTGDLPIPDREGFLAWLQSGKAFIGLHAATDTFPGWPESKECIGAHNFP